MTTKNAYWTTALGSMLGSVMGGLLLGWLANTTIGGGLEAIVPVVLLTLGGFWGGAVAGVWAALSSKHVPRIARTVGMFGGVLLLAIVPLFLLIVWLVALLPLNVFPDPSGTLRVAVPLMLGIGAIAAGVRRISLR